MIILLFSLHTFFFLNGQPYTVIHTAGRPLKKRRNIKKDRKGDCSIYKVQKNGPMNMKKKFRNFQKKNTKLHDAFSKHSYRDSRRFFFPSENY